MPIPLKFSFIFAPEIVPHNNLIFNFMDGKISESRIKIDLSCFKVTISKDGQSATVVCPWDAQYLFNQVVNALNFGNIVTIDTHFLKPSDHD